MARSSAGRLFSGLVVGVVLGGGLALLLTPRANVAVPDTAARRASTGPTPFEPANQLIVRARGFVDEVRQQVRQAVEEGRATAAQTRQELTARFEAAKRGPEDDEADRV